MKRRYDTERQIIIHHGTRPVGSLRELLDESEATGTGSGVPLLVRKLHINGLGTEYFALM